MKSSKLFLTSLLAAATMSATAFAEDKAYTSNQAISSDLAVDGKISVNSGATVTQSAGTVSATRLVLNDSGANTASFYTLTGGVLNITGTGKTGGVTNNTTTTNAVLIGHWKNGTSKLTVSGGTLNVTEGFTVISWDSAGTLEVSGGTANLYGVSLNTFRGNAANVTLSSGRLNLGAGGLTYGSGTNGTTDKTVTLSGGTLGALTDWSSDVAMSLSGNVTIDTTKQVVGDDGTSAASSDNAGATITLGGNISNTGTLVVSGTGRLELASTGTLTGNVEVTSGSFTVAGTLNLSSAVTVAGTASVSVSNTAVFVLSDSLKIGDTGNTYSLISGNTSGITGWNDTTLNIDNFRKADGSYFSGRSGLDLSTAGTVTITGDIAYNLYWKGAASGTWNKSDTAIFGKDSAAGTGTAFVNGDNMTFATSDAVVTIGETVRAGTITISENTTFSASSANTLSASSVAVESGTLTLNGGISSYSFGSVNIAENATLKAIVLPAGDTSAEPAQNTTVDYSGVTGTGTLTLGLRSDNGVGFNLSNFEGTIRVERGTGVTAASRFQLNTSTLNANARIVVADGNDLVFNDNTNKNVSNAVTFEGSGTIHVNGSCSGTLSGNVTSAGTLTKKGGGTLTFSNSLKLNNGNLTISDGIVQINNATDNTGENKKLTSVTIANGKALQVFNSAKLTNPTTIDLLTVSGASATVRIGTTADNGGNSHSGIVLIKDIASGTGTLNLELKANTSERSIFELGASDVTSVGAFTGTIAFSATNTSADRPGSLVISNGSIASKALVSLATATGSSAILSLGVNADRVTIGGLSSTLGTTKAKVYSGSIGFGTSSSTGYGDSSSASGTARTLIINTEASDYSFNGEILANLNLEKTGAGTQTLAGASTAFNGSVKVSGGVLALADASAIGFGNAVRIDGGQLKVGNGTTAVSLNAAAYTIVLSDAYSGVAAIVGTNTENKSSVALATDTKITIELADSVAVSLAAEAAQYQYKIFDTATIDDSFTIESFALSEALKSDWRISGYMDGVLTISAIPEPSMFGLLAGLGALALAGARRRRKKA